MWLRLQTLWLLASGFCTPTQPERERDRHTHTHTRWGGQDMLRPTPISTHKCKHSAHTETPLLPFSQNRRGKAYQVIGGKIDDDSITVQILSHAALGWTIPTKSTPRGWSSMPWCPYWCLHRAGKGCISISHISVSRLWRSSGTVTHGETGMGPKKTELTGWGLPSLIRAPSPWLMFGFLATKTRRLHPLLRIVWKSGGAARCFNLFPSCVSCTAASKTRKHILALFCSWCQWANRGYIWLQTDVNYTYSMTDCLYVASVCVDCSLRTVRIKAKYSEFFLSSWEEHLLNNLIWMWTFRNLRWHKCSSHFFKITISLFWVEPVLLVFHKITFRLL